MPQLGEIYAQQGFFSPVSAISETEAKELRQDYEAAERELHGSDWGNVSKQNNF